MNIKENCRGCGAACASSSLSVCRLEESTANNENLLLLVQLRWIAVFGQIVTIFLINYVFNIKLPLWEMSAVLAGLVAINLVSLERYRRRERITNEKLLIELLVDVAAFTVQIYLSGGATNPFISLYILHVILGAVLLDIWAAWLLTAITGVCFVLLCMHFRPIEMPGHAHGDLFGLHIQGMFFCFLLASCLLVFFVSRINRNLRARDAHLAELRQRSAEEDHIVRIGLLASGAAHELGTPLATVSVILNDWRKIPALAHDGELAQDMAEMQLQLDRCKTILSGILMSSGEVRGEGTVRATLGGFLDAAIEEWRAARSPRRFDFVNRISPDEPIVSDLAVKQILFNLLDNAYEASPDWLEATAERRGCNLTVTVRDAGPGFSAEVLANFGKPYISTKERFGAGLGLFLVVNVVRKLGGLVVASNRAEGGSSVALTLPLAALKGSR